MKELFIISFFLCTVWDFATSFLGVVGVFGISEFDRSSLFSVNDLAVYITAMVASLAILSLSLLSEIIWRRDTKALYRQLRLPHIIAILFDAYTSFLGTAQSVILRQGKTTFIDIGIRDVLSQVTFEQFVFLMLITMIITVSPIVLSKINAKSLASKLDLPEKPPARPYRYVRRNSSPANSSKPPQYPPTPPFPNRPPQPPRRNSSPANSSKPPQYPPTPPFPDQPPPVSDDRRKN